MNMLGTYWKRMDQVAIWWISDIKTWNVVPTRRPRGYSVGEYAWNIVATWEPRYNIPTNYRPRGYLVVIRWICLEHTSHVQTTCLFGGSYVDMPGTYRPLGNHVVMW